VTGPNLLSVLKLFLWPIPFLFSDEPEKRPSQWRRFPFPSWQNLVRCAWISYGDSDWIQMAASMEWWVEATQNNLCKTFWVGSEQTREPKWVYKCSLHLCVCFLSNFLACIPTLESYDNKLANIVPTLVSVTGEVQDKLEHAFESELAGTLPYQVCNYFVVPFQTNCVFSNCYSLFSGFKFLGG